MAFSYASFITFGALLFTVMISCVCNDFVCLCASHDDCMLHWESLRLHDETTYLI